MGRHVQRLTQKRNFFDTVPFCTRSSPPFLDFNNSSLQKNQNFSSNFIHSLQTFKHIQIQNEIKTQTLMLYISRMKSLLSPTLFPSLNLTKPSPSSLSQTPYSSQIKKPFTSIKSSMAASQLSCGEVHVITGPMFAGKTTALLRRIQCETDKGRSVAIIKSNKDTRYGLDSIVTHDGARLPCWALPDLLSFRDKLGADAYDKLDVIGIDEAQFFGDLYDFCCKTADIDGKVVIVAGLDGDYLRKRFGSVLDIIPLADSVTKLTARCELCGKRAFFTLRKTDDTQTELIAGADVYMPVCRRHYVSGQVVIEAARSVLEERKIQCDSHIEIEAEALAV